MIKYIKLQNLKFSKDDPERFQHLILGAKKWIRNLPNSVMLGITTFKSENKCEVVMEMTRVTEDSRDVFFSKLDELSVSSGEAACIGCGLSLAAQLLSPRRGGQIVVTSAGPNKCQDDTSPLCVSLSDALNLLENRGIRVDTIAMGPEADSELEDIAERTGGQSYFFDDNSGIGNIKDAFHGTTRILPRNVWSETVVSVYQRQWNYSGETKRYQLRKKFNASRSNLTLIGIYSKLMNPSEDTLL